MQVRVFPNADMRCLLPDGSFLVLDDTRSILLAVRDNVTQAADIILLVDESGSMAAGHQWIPDMVAQLDTALIKAGIGVNPRNRFGITGFGDDCSGDTFLGRVFLSQGNEAYVLAENITMLAQKLNLGGKYEDGYGAIASALRQYTFRRGVRHFILISNEDRDILSNVTRDDVELMLDESSVILNVVVNQEFSAEGIRALGIDGYGTAYIYDPSTDSLFRTVDEIAAPIQDSAHGSTDYDYTQLAFLVNGSSWDLSLLQKGMY